MKFKLWLENEEKILAHISGASGSGKTTLANNLQIRHPNIIFKDLDDFDDDAVNILGWDGIRKNDYNDEMLLKLANLRQKLMDDFVQKATKSIVLIGHHTEGQHVLNIPTKNRFLLNTDARTSALRAYKRSQNEDPRHRRTLEELPHDEQEAQEAIDYLLKNGYKSLSRDEILKWINSN